MRRTPGAGPGRSCGDLAAASAKDVCVLSEGGPEAGREQWVPASRLRAGQRFVVRPGERIAADGEVLAGQSAVDRSMMTGESVPVDAVAGDVVTGGTIALTGRLVVRADKVGRDTQLATPAALVVASGRGARMGIFIKGYQALESSRAIDTVVLDKTGTVTTGQMTVTAVPALPAAKTRVIAWPSPPPT